MPSLSTVAEYSQRSHIFRLIFKLKKISIFALAKSKFDRNAMTGVQTRHLIFANE